MQEIEVKASERVSCVVFSEKPEANNAALRNALRMGNRLIAIGAPCAIEAALRQFALTLGEVEICPAGTTLPTGHNVITFDAVSLGEK